MPVRRNKGDGISAAEINHPHGLVQRGGAFQGIHAKKLKLRTLEDLHGRTRAAIRAQQWFADMMDELGGVERVSLAKQTLLQRAAFLRALAEHMEVLQMEGKDIHVGSYATLVQTLTNLLRNVGLDRFTKDVSPDLSAYLRHRATESNDVSDRAKHRRGETGSPGGGAENPAAHRDDADFSITCCERTNLGVGSHENKT
jgi:hypothetical protein